MDMLLEPTLKSLGLNETQIKVYLALLATGTAPASAIAKRTNLPRSTARYVCQQLVSMELALVTSKMNSQIFTAKNPSHLESFLDKDREELEQKEQSLSRIVGELQSIYNPDTVLPKVTFYESVEGGIAMLEDVLKENCTLYAALKLTDDIHPEILRYLQQEYIPRRAAMKNRCYAIYNDTPMNREYQKRDQQLNRTTLLVPENEFPFEQLIHIYGNKVALYSGRNYDLAGVIIENKDMRLTQLSLFKLAWNYARLLNVNQHYKDVSVAD